MDEGSDILLKVAFFLSVFYELINSKSNVDYIQLLQEKVGNWKLIGTRFIETPTRLIVIYMYLYSIGYDERKIEIKEKNNYDRIYHVLKYYVDIFWRFVKLSFYVRGLWFSHNVTCTYSDWSAQCSVWSNQWLITIIIDR